MKRVVVTGANGFIGSMLCRKMVECGIEIIAIDRSFQINHLPHSSLITEVESSLDDFEELIKKLPDGGYDTFYHLAWQGVNGCEKADPFIQLNNIKTVLKSAEFAKNTGCKKFLCAGTVAEQAVKSLENLNKTSGGMMYGTAKHCAHLMLETYCKNIGLNFIWMQFSNIYGPSNKTGNLISYTIGELSNNRPALFGPALQPYDFIYADDLIEAIYRLGDNDVPDNYYFIGSGKPRILKDYLLQIGEIYGKQELIRIGERPDDGIVYSYDMFDTSKLNTAIGNYISRDFASGISETINKFTGEQK